MASRNSIEFSIPLTLSNGTIIQPTYCRLTADSLEGYTRDAIQRCDEILLDFIISSGTSTSPKAGRIYLVTHAHPDVYDSKPCTWFMAVPRPLEE
jgi:hypothetical protein